MVLVTAWIISYGSVNDVLSDPPTEWSKIHGNRLTNKKFDREMVEALQRNIPVNDMLLFGHSGTIKSMIFICAAILANRTVFSL